MKDWSAQQYLKFKEQRTLPAIDLANRIHNFQAKTIIDVGCGPGNSTAVLKETFPNAEIIGIDNSPDMIEKARINHPELNFRLCGAHKLEGKYDVIFSNACLQWIPEHNKLIPFLLDRLTENGVLAVQVPINGSEPLYRIIDEVVNEEKWGFKNIELPANKTLTSDEYFDILTDCARDFQIWETVYYHNMPSPASLVEWVKGTRLRPYIQALDADAAAELENEIAEKAANAYPKMSSGEVILRFRRLFFTAEK